MCKASHGYQNDNNIIDNTVGYLIQYNQIKTQNLYSTLFFYKLSPTLKLMIKSINHLSIFKFLLRTLQPDILAKSAHCLNLHNFLLSQHLILDKRFKWI